MSALRLKSLYRCTKQIKFFRSAHTASKTQSDLVPETLPKQDAKISEASVGITVASVENYSPISYVAVAVKAGSVYENENNLGIVHCLRNCSAVSTKNLSAFSLTRSLEAKGSKLSVESTREHIIYTLQCVRDEIHSGLQILADVVTQAAFKSWEVNELSSKMHLDLALHNSTPEAVLLENLHKAAFRGGLKNSLYSPTYMIGKHSSEMIHNFVNSHFLASRTSVVGLGVNHDYLEEGVNKLFDMSNTGAQTGENISKFGGGEVRVDVDIPFVHAAIVAEGSGLSNLKEALSLEVLRCILGTGSHNTFSNAKFSLLGEAATKCTNNPFAVSCLNISYADTGLFGVYVSGQPKDMSQLVKSIVSQMRKIGSKLTDSAVENAKHAVKSQLRIERETSKEMLSGMVRDVSQFGKIKDMKEIDKCIEELKVSDIAAVAAKVTKTKPAMASVGLLHSTPHLDELM